MNTRPRAVVIGGGIVGLAVARELDRDGWSVTLLEQGRPASEASRAAAGMIAPGVEFEPGTWLRTVGDAARQMYPSYVAELEEATGCRVDLRLGGLLVPLLDGEEEMSTRWEGCPRRLSAPEARELEPALSATVLGGYLHADHGSVDNRALTRALEQDLKQRGVTVLSSTRVREVLVADDHVTGVRTDTESLPAEVTVNCAGAWAGQLRVPGCEVNVKPIKGHMLSVDTRPLAREKRPGRVLYSHTAYIVPRSDGRVIVGTTVEDRGFDRTVEAGPVAALVERASRVWPAVREAGFLEAWTGFRPLGTAQGPMLGPLGPRGHFVAIGHYRNGILLAPWSAKLLASQVSGRSETALISPG